MARLGGCVRRGRLCLICCVRLGTFVSRLLGKPILRKEDPALLSGRGRYADDLPVPIGTLQAHVVRSSRAHAEIVRIDTA